MATIGGPPIITNGLVLHLDAANEKSFKSGNTIWRDLSKNGNNGTLTNGPTFSSANNGSIVFDGVDDYVTGSISSISNWTLNIWLLSTNISSKFVYYPFSCAINSSTTYGAGIGFGGTFDSIVQNKWYFYDGNISFSSDATSVVINKWYNLVVTKNSTSYNLYTNGLFSLNATGVNLTCSQYSLGRRLDGIWNSVGSISQAMIYNRELTAQEVLQNYNSTKGRFNL
jgi:hypothetical protein